jgi:5-methylcytosine-specific restriction endonuclease McrA
METFFKHDMVSRAAEKLKKQARAREAWAAVCKLVDVRDRGRCRACGRRCDPRAIGLVERAERHHIVYRSAGGEDDAFNVVTVCAVCHGDQHAGRLDIRGNAQWGIEIWRRSDDGEWYLSRRETAVHTVEKD